MSGIGAYLAFSRPASVSGAEIVSTFRDLFPYDHARIEEVTQNLTDLSIFKAYGQEVLIVVLQRRLPRHVYRFALKTGGWDGARRALRWHRGSAIITLRGEPKDWRDAVAGAKAVAAIACAMIARMPAVAALVECSQALLPPDMFVEINSAFMRDDEPATLLWVSARRHSFDATTVLSYGLAEFVGREIEFSTPELPPEEIQERVQCMSHYLLTRGPVIEDGDSFATVPAEKMRVRYAAEGLRPGIPIYRLTLEVADPSAISVE